MAERPERLFSVLSVGQEAPAERAREAPPEKLSATDRIRFPAIETFLTALNSSCGEHAADRRRDISECHVAYGDSISSEYVRDPFGLVLRQMEIESARRRRLGKNMAEHIGGPDSIEGGMPTDP